MVLVRPCLCKRPGCNTDKSLHALCALLPAAAVMLWPLQHLAAGGQLDLTLLQGLIGHAWAREPAKERYDAQADREDAAFQVCVLKNTKLYIVQRLTRCVGGGAWVEGRGWKGSGGGARSDTMHRRTGRTRPTRCAWEVVGLGWSGVGGLVVGGSI